MLIARSNCELKTCEEALSKNIFCEGITDINNMALMSIIIISSSKENPFDSFILLNIDFDSS